MMKEFKPESGRGRDSPEEIITTDIAAGVRNIDLGRYLPPVTADILEFQEIVTAENPEFRFLAVYLQQILGDNFLTDASVNGIRHYEVMLGITPQPDATLEERRREIQIRWMQQIPYTLPRLKEMLNGWVGEEYYTVDTSGFKDYQIGVEIREQKIAFLRFLKKELRNIIPANLVFEFSARYAERVKWDISYDTRMAFLSEFYPRGNKPYLFLDGTWNMDGRYYLNGWQDAEDDYYRSRLRLQSDNKVNVQTENTLTVEKDLWLLDGTYSLDGEKLLDAEVIEYAL